MYVINDPMALFAEVGTLAQVSRCIYFPAFTLQFQLDTVGFTSCPKQFCYVLVPCSVAILPCLRSGCMSITGIMIALFMVYKVIEDPLESKVLWTCRARLSPGGNWHSSVDVNASTLIDSTSKDLAYNVLLLVKS